MFRISSTSIIRDNELKEFSSEESGALVVFEGLVRNLNSGLQVRSLEYEIYHQLAQHEADLIIQEAQEKFPIHRVLVIHREGHLRLNETAILIAVTSSHRDEAYKASRYLIDQIKIRLPVWKKEHYVNHPAEWVFCRDHIHHHSICDREYYQKQKTLVDQDLLKSKRILIVGVGGLGCQVALNLVQAGVGEITLVDDDKVSVSNLHRQLLYQVNQVGESKVEKAQTYLMGVNPFVKINSRISIFKSEMLKGVSLVIDATDSLSSKSYIHDSCLAQKIPLISASVFKFMAIIQNYDFQHGCQYCHLDQMASDAMIGNCNDVGVLGATVSAIGAMQAQLAIKALMGKNVFQEHFLVDLDGFSIQTITTERNPHCGYCDKNSTITSRLIEISAQELDLKNDILIDVKELDAPSTQELIKSSHRHVLYCRRGVKSFSITQQLRKMGHEQVYSLKGGECSL